MGLSARLRLGAVALAAGLLLGACGVIGGGPAVDCATTAGNVVECAPGKRPAAPSITGELLGGGTYDLADHRGKVVVVNFWASWCPPCRAEAEDLEATYQSTKDSGVTFVGINFKDDRDKAAAFLQGRASYPSIFDPTSKLALGFTETPPITAPPVTVIIDRAGDIAALIRAAVRQPELEPLIARVAADPPPEAAD